MEPVPLPAPWGGYDERAPLITLQSPNCQSLLNFNITQGGVVLRHGDSFYKSITAGGGTIAKTLHTYGFTKLFISIYNASDSKMYFYDVEADAFGYSTAASGVDTFYSQEFNKYLFFFSPGTYTPGVYYSGAAWGVIGYTGTGFTPTGGGNAYKNRNYVVQSNDAAYWYSGIDAITGALTKVDLNGIVSERCTLSNIASITLADSVSTTELQAFIMSNGEILFYTGAYPNSPDWSIVGRSKVGAPLSLDGSIVEYQGDKLLLCDSGIVSLRDLFLKGSEQAISLSISSPIQYTWSKIVAGGRSLKSRPSGFLDTGIRGVWDQAKNRLVFFFPFYINSSGVVTNGNVQFVFHTLLGKWCLHQTDVISSGLVLDAVIFSNKLLFITQTSASYLNVMQKEGATGYADRDGSNAVDVAYDYEIISAPVSNGRAYVQKCCGMDFILKSDLFTGGGWIDFKLIRDMGVASTTAQRLQATHPTTLQKTFVNMGIEGSYIQYKISGKTAASKTVGLELYGSNFWVEMGRSPR